MLELAIFYGSIDNPINDGWSVSLPSTICLNSFRSKLLVNAQCIVFKYLLAYAPQVTLQMENNICQCKFNEEDQIEAKLPTLLDS